jgi:ethanolamine utilization protein EutQ (cupin superfamily)
MRVGHRVLDHVLRIATAAQAGADPALRHKQQIGAIIVQQLADPCRIDAGLPDQIVHTNIIVAHRMASILGIGMMAQ